MRSLFLSFGHLVVISITISYITAVVAEDNARLEYRNRTAAFQYLSANQRCDNEMFLVFNNDFKRGTFGAHLHALSMAFMSALTSARVLVSADVDEDDARLQIRNGHVEKQTSTGDWIKCQGILCYISQYTDQHCYVPAITSIDFSSSKLFYSNHTFIGYGGNIPPHIRYSVPLSFRSGPDWSWDLLRKSWNAGGDDYEHVKDFVEIADRYLISHSKDVFWWWSQVMGFLFRPRPFLINHIDEYRKNLGWEKPMACIHIRRGDKVLLNSGEDFMHHTREYFEKLEVISANYSFKKVLIMSDDIATVKEELKEIMTSIDPKFHDIIYGDPGMKGFDVRNPSKSNTALRSFVELAILSDCGLLVGQGASFFFKTAVLIQASKNDNALYGAVGLSKDPFLIGERISPLVPWLSFT